MKTMKKAMAVMAAIGMTVTGSGVSYAAETEAVETSVTYADKSFSEADPSKGTESVITGHIKVTDISVKVPITSSFDIDPNKAVEAGTESKQVLSQADNYTITNLSAVPLEVTITKVATGTVSGEAVTLVNTVDELVKKENKRAVMFAIRKAGENAPLLSNSTSDGDYKKWMMSTISDANLYKVAAADADNIIQASGSKTTVGGQEVKTDELPMTVYAAIKNGWTAGESFTVTPTFTVALHKDTTPAP